MMIDMFKTKPKCVCGLQLKKNKLSIIEALIFLNEVEDYADLLIKVAKTEEEGVLDSTFCGEIDFGDYIIKDKNGYAQIIRQDDVKNQLTAAF